MTRRFMMAVLVGAAALGAGCSERTKLWVVADQSDPQLRLGLEGVIDRFRQRHPDIEVKREIFDHEEYKPKLLEWLKRDEAPDVVYWYGGERMMPYVNLLEDISDVWDEANGGKARDDMASTIDLVTAPDGKQYGVPYTFYNWGLYYRKDLFEKAGVLSPPRTWPELLEACQKLQESGMTPIVIGTKALWPAAGWFDYLDLRINGPEFHMDLMAGKVPYTDPRVRAVFAHWRQLLPYFSRDHDRRGWQASQPEMYRGKGAMALIGNFVTPELPPEVRDRVGFFPFPEITEGVPPCEDAPTDTVHIPRNARSKAAARKFMAFLMDPEEQGVLNARLNEFPTNKRAPVPDDPFVRAGRAIIQRADATGRCRGKYGPPQFYDRDTTPAMAEAGLKAFQEFMLHPNRLDAVLQQLEARRQEVFGDSESPHPWISKAP